MSHLPIRDYIIDKDAEHDETLIVVHRPDQTTQQPEEALKNHPPKPRYDATKNRLPMSEQQLDLNANIQSC
jgi:hypothetical protein